ncbi:hypothetical protein ACVWYH_008521 [Bradyrhizobium sp. GM24.11]
MKASRWCAIVSTKEACALSRRLTNALAFRSRSASAAKRDTDRNAIADATAIPFHSGDFIS